MIIKDHMEEECIKENSHVNLENRYSKHNYGLIIMSEIIINHMRMRKWDENRRHGWKHASRQIHP